LVVLDDWRGKGHSALTYDHLVIPLYT